MWIEALRLLPPLPREQRIPFANGLGLSFMLAAQIGGGFGYFRDVVAAAVERGAAVPHADVVPDLDDAQLPPAVGLARARFRSRAGSLLAFWQVGLDLLWTGIVGGSLAYGIYRLREARR